MGWLPAHRFALSGVEQAWQPWAVSMSCRRPRVHCSRHTGPPAQGRPLFDAAPEA